MPQDRQDAYHDYFAALHDFSQSRFGVTADTGDLQIYIVDGACGGIVIGGTVIGGSPLGIDHLTFGDECMDNRGLFGLSIAEAYFQLLVDWSLLSAAPDWTTQWMLYGSMLYFSYIWIDHHHAMPYEGHRNNSASYLSVVGDAIPPLSQDSVTSGGSQSLAFLAIDYLAEQTGATKLIDYFAAARRSTPAGFAEDFQNVFGISPDEFYRYFASHRAAGFPQPGAPFRTPTPTPTSTHTPTSTPEQESPTPTYTPTATPVSGGQIDNRVSELERQTGMLQQLIQNLQALIQALTTRVDALDGGAPQPIHTPTPTATPSPTPTSVPGTDPTPVIASACIQQIELAALIAGTTITGSWTPDCLTANPDPTNPTIEFFAKFYTFTLDGREELEIQITSDDTPYIFLMAGEGTAGEVIGRFAVEPGEQTQLVLDPGSYTMEVTTDGSGVTGGFTLELNLRR